MRKVGGFSGVGRATVLIIAAAYVLIPIAVMLLESVKNAGQIFSDPLGLPNPLVLQNYEVAWDRAGFSTFAVNSVIVTMGALAVSLSSASALSYLLARHRSGWSNAVLIVFSLGLVLPIRLLAAPLLITVKTLGLLNSLFGLILVYSAVTLPFAVFVLTNFMSGVPREMDDAARVDGAGDFTIYRRIILPLSAPAIAVVTIYNLVFVWDDYFLPLIFLKSANLQTMPLGLATFFGDHTTEWDLVFAALAITALPLLLCFIVVSRQFITGVTEGAIK